MNVETIGIIGYGHFGKFVHELTTRFLPEVDVRVCTKDGTTPLESVASCDVVFLCVPISSYEEVLKDVLPHLGKDTVVVDVATVKKHTSDLFRRHLADRAYVCCHPMFGAESYKKTNGDVSGYRIVVTDSTVEPEEYKTMQSFLTKLGFIVIELSAEEHDRLLAETLFLTHYVGQTMKAGEFGRTVVDTVSFSSLMNAVEAVQNDDQLFADVYTYNPYCKDVAARFHKAQENVFKGLA